MPDLFDSTLLKGNVRHGMAFEKSETNISIETFVSVDGEARSIAAWNGCQSPAADLGSSK